MSESRRVVRADRPQWTLRPTPSAALRQFSVFAPLSVGGGLLVAAAGQGDALVAAVAFGLLVIAFTVCHATRVEGYADRVEFRRALGTTVVRFDEVIAFVLTWHDYRTGSGYWVDVALQSRTVRWWQGLSRGAWGQIQQVVDAHPQILLNPTRPWLDRFGVWHIDHQDEDPREAIRTVRRAFVGPWIIRAASAESGFRATWALVADQRNLLAEGVMRENLDAAISDAAEFVEQAQARVGDLSP